MGLLVWDERAVFPFKTQEKDFMISFSICFCLAMYCLVVTLSHTFLDCYLRSNVCCYLLFFNAVRPQQELCQWTLSVRVHLRVRKRKSSQSAVQRITQTCPLNTGRSRNWSSTSRYGIVTPHTTESFLWWIRTKDGFSYRELFYCMWKKATLTGNNIVYALYILCLYKNFDTVLSQCLTFKNLYRIAVHGS